jgi:hypothetical protein
MLRHPYQGIHMAMTAMEATEFPTMPQRLSLAAHARTPLTTASMHLHPSLEILLAMEERGAMVAVLAGKVATKGIREFTSCSC